MQDTSLITRWDSIVAGGNYWYETRLRVGNAWYGESQLFSISTNVEMFQNTPTIGKAVAGEIEIKMLKPAADIPVMARLEPQVRVKNATQSSGWMSQGVYFIDTRETTQNHDGLDVLTIHGYDAMLKAEQMFALNITGSRTDKQMVAAIAGAMGVSVDSRTNTLMNKGYTIPLPTGYTYREILGYIAAMYCGCFIMSETGRLRLVSLLELPAETNYLINEAGFAITFGGDRILV